MLNCISFKITPNNRKVEAFMWRISICPIDDPSDRLQASSENQTDGILRALNPMGKVPVLVDGDFYSCGNRMRF